MKFHELKLKGYRTWCSSWSTKEEDGNLLLVDDSNKIIGKVVYIGDLHDAFVDLRDDIPKKKFLAAQKAANEKKNGFWRVSSETLKMVIEDENGKLKMSHNIDYITVDDELMILPGLFSYHEGECCREEVISSKKRLMKYIEEYNGIVVEF